MKKLFYSLLFTTAFMNAQVTSFPWTETFETDSPTVEDWTQIQESGSKQWSIVQEAYTGYDTGPYAGSYMAEFDITAFSGSTTKYVSPILNLSSATNPTLEFYFRNKDWDGDQNEINVYYRTSASGAWTLISNYNTSIDDWTSSGVLPLPSPSATYQIAIEGVAWYGRSINVDNVTVNTGTLSTSEVKLKASEIRISPNPVSNILSINSKDKIIEITIHDASGKAIKSESITNNNTSVEYLKPGVYFITTKNSNGTSSTSKFIKK
ncbi:T9SS type A sorting domain-containing protein [Chryseobacterium indologenes]|uniref:Secretion system C-terminal sorting domain-containing protein n=1 Tax=Chryseobacterium indologenes TaxID=253 RepID=A0A0N0IWK7_CHRID|nr:T9SS type A sorting domain-containing protein [Chryseobacterium indologenes]KPE51481.1 hypothetical protein AOB46_10115 [Chryseobacterium indologenes]